jgi:hypothetical protein
MIKNNQKTSLLINSQLPDYLKSDPNYETFIRFIEAYYEWMENGVGGATVINGGSNYQYPPIVTIEGDGYGAAAIAELHNGSISKIKITSSGSGYTTANIIITPDSRDETGSGGIASLYLNSSINPEERAKNLLNYKDIDKTTDEFIDYFVNEFLQYFPKNTLINKSTAVKASRELYSAKGTPAAYDFLFRVLYNSDFESFYTKELVLRASDGIWYVSKSLKLATNDPRFLEINNYRILGETSKSIATIESSIISGSRIEVFISNIFRLFQSGESVRIVDNNNQNVIIGGQILTSKIVGQVSRVSIDSNYRGQYYSVGDPVIVYGGLNSASGKGALAEVGSVTSGSIDRMLTLQGGFGYVPYKKTSYGTENISNTRISLTNSPGSNVIVASVNTLYGVANATYIPSDSILLKSDKLISDLQYYFNAYDINVSPKIDYDISEIVYQGSSLASNTFTASVVDLDSSNNTLTLSSSSFSGSLSNNTLLKGSTSGAVATVEGYLIQGSNTILTLSSSYTVGEYVYQGTSLSTSTYKAKVSSFNSSNNIIHVQFADGVPDINVNIIGANTGRIRQVLSYANTNANTQLSDAFSFYNYTTYPISSVSVINGSAGIVNQPIAVADSLYVNDENKQSNLRNLGILAPIQVIDGGSGYLSNDTIIFSGGSGYGAHANIISVSESGSIINVEYVYGDSLYPLGGLGYNIGDLPSININTSTGANAVLSIPGILGEGAEFNIVTERIGSITNIKLLDGGEDYISTPNVSLKVNDIVVANVSILNSPQKGDIIYQGESVNASSYRATVNSISLLQPYSDPTQSLYNLRVFEYTSRPNTNLPFKIERDEVINITLANTQFSSAYDLNGIRGYGDGRARASASFLNGLVLSDGTYLNTRGQPSGSSLIQSDIYNNYTYLITVEKEIQKYRETLLNLVHPAGTRLLGRYALIDSINSDMSSLNAFYSGYPLSHYTGSTSSGALIVGNFVNKSNNIVEITNIGNDVDIAEFIFANSSTIQITDNTGINVKSKVVSVNSISNTVTLEANTWLTYSNVAYITANSGSNVINITSLTNSYNIVNNGNYSNTMYPLKDIVIVGDRISIENNDIKTVTSVNYLNSFITVDTNFANNSISTLTVNRTIQSTDVIIYGPVGTVYIPQLMTEDNFLITTEDDKILILG